MKIVSIETLRADAGWRSFSFLKLVTDTGITGWSEYNESFGSRGLSEVIEKLAPLVIGQDPRPYERVISMLHVYTRQSQGGVTHQAIAAIENALLDTKAKDLGIPVYALFGGPAPCPLIGQHVSRFARILFQGLVVIVERGVEVLASLGFLAFFQVLVAFFGARPERHHEQRHAAYEQCGIP